MKTNRIKMEKMPLYEDIQEMIEKINKKPDEFIRTRNMVVFRVLRGTGLRQSELANLDMKDVYLDDKYIDERHPRPYILVLVREIMITQMMGKILFILQRCNLGSKRVVDL